MLQERGPLFDALRLRASTLRELQLDGDVIHDVLTSVDDFTGLRELLALLEACHMLTEVRFDVDDDEEAEGEGGVHQNEIPEALEVRQAMVSLLESRGGTISF